MSLIVFIWRLCVFFFFKQKTAYELRISDWSSDVCSSDLFDAPVMLFLHCSRIMGPPQWSDMGMWLQSVMLLLVEHGLASCPQECWAMYGETIRRTLGL